MGTFKKYYPAKVFRWYVTPLKEIKEMLIRRRENEKDNMILVTGARGEGKSTFTGKILFNFEDFDPYKSMVYSKDAMFKLIKQKRGYIWADEAVVNSAKGNVMTRANKMLFEISTINRDNFNIVFFCMPFVEDFDSKILQYVSMWVHIDSRGLGVLMLPSNKGIFGKRNWDLTAMKKVFDEFKKENQKVMHAPYWIYDNFRGYIKFGKLTVKQKEIVDEVKALRKNENSDKEMQQEIEVEVKSLENYSRYSAKKLSDLIAKGEIRSMEQFNDTCKEMKVNPEELLKKCDSLFKKSGSDKTARAKIKEYERLDDLIKF